MGNSVTWGALVSCSVWTANVLPLFHTLCCSMPNMTRYFSFLMFQFHCLSSDQLVPDHPASAFHQPGVTRRVFLEWQTERSLGKCPGEFDRHIFMVQFRSFLISHLECETSWTRIGAVFLCGDWFVIVWPRSFWDIVSWAHHFTVQKQRCCRLTINTWLQSSHSEVQPVYVNISQMFLTVGFQTISCI